MPPRKPEPQYVVCLRNDGYKAALQVRRLYQVLSDPDAEERGLLRVIDESGEDYLFPAKLFAVVDLPKPVSRKFAAS
jgi:hypothetical protein